MDEPSREPVLRLEKLKKGRAMVIPAKTIVWLPEGSRVATLVVLSTERVKFTSEPISE